MAEARVEWRRMQPDLQGRLIFLDETGARTDMTRRHAWSDVGTRALGRAPDGHWKTTTFLAGLTANGLIAPFVLDGPMDRAAFTEYVRQVLVPELRAGDVVILDTAPIFYALGGTVALFDREGRRLGDLLADTLVVRDDARDIANRKALGAIATAVQPRST